MLPPRQREVLDGPDVMAGPYCIVSSRRHAEIITVENLADADTSRGLDLKINDQSYCLGVVYRNKKSLRSPSRKSRERRSSPSETSAGVGAPFIG